MLLDHHLARLEGLLQDIDGRSWVGVAAHEDVESGIAILGPAVDGDVRLGKNRDSGNSTVRREVMQVDVQKGGACHLHASPERVLDVLQIVEPFGSNEIDDQMSARVTDPIALTEKVLAHLSVGREAPGKLFFRLGGA
jgi:hypothetical protein